MALATDSFRPKRQRKRLRRRIVWSVLAIGSLLSVLFAAFALFLRASLEERIIDQVLQREVSSFAEEYLKDPKSIIEYSLIKGRVVSDRRYDNAPADWQGLAPGVHRIVNSAPNSGALANANERTAYKLAIHREPGLWFFLQYDVTAEERTRRVVTVAILSSVVAFAGLALLLGWWSASRIMSPVTELVRRVNRLGRNNKVESLAPYFPDDEVGQLAQSLDDYSSRLTELVERDREFNSDVSHELRTPLAVIQSTTELLLNMPELGEKARARLNRIERSAKHSTELITALLHLSRGERQAPNDGESTDVGLLINSIVDSHRHHLLGKSIHVKVEVLEPLLVDAPESVLSVLIGNLVANAFKYTREGEVLIRVHANGVSVQDTGPGIPLEEREKVFERHFRGSTGGGSGAGLGLSILNRLCDLYGWQVSLQPREPHGLDAALRLRVVS